MLKIDYKGVELIFWKKRLFFVEVVTPNSRKITSKRLQSAFNKKMTSMSSKLEARTGYAIHVPGRRSLGKFLLRPSLFYLLLVFIKNNN